ncbi:hypothetical protein [Trinickia fusca]|uniref:Uncharacterized protein n=1 Tax=Trinickia fusca TaxID=2419777 RepID=A0A494XT68_9BURK|nr:hypothetical protein [Trinickia fusca]RKP50723.1 hypothetical protein D7S89_06460 [Trinickia fusca]
MNNDAQDQLVREAQALSTSTMGLRVVREQSFEVANESHIDAFFGMLQKVGAGVTEVCHA